MASFNLNDPTPSGPRRPRAYWAVLAFGALIILLVIGYAVENWRGRRAWEQCKRELEGNGAVLDWSAYVPPTVAPHENLFDAPNIKNWFVRTPGIQSPGWPPGTGKPRELRDTGTSGVIAEVTVTESGAPPGTNAFDLVVRAGDDASIQQGRALLKQLVGPAVAGVASCYLVAHNPAGKPAQLLVLMDPNNQKAGSISNAGMKEIGGLLLAGQSGNTNFLYLATGAGNSFRVTLHKPVYTAEEYLAWSDQFDWDFREIRRALDLPGARIAGDYEHPLQLPYINFVAVRSVAMILGQRAQCHLLLHQPEAALRELTLIHDFSRLLNGRPGMLVSAMIEAALAGIYTEIVAQGLSLNAWTTPQLLAIESQLKSVALPERLAVALNVERASSFRILEDTPATELADRFGDHRQGASWTEGFRRGRLWLYVLGPRGWIYQNEVAYARLTRHFLAGIDATNHVVQPAKIQEAAHVFTETQKHITPYVALAARMVPNYARAFVTVARQQSLVNEALLACELERYRLAQHEYPETLSALVPQYAATVPHEVTNGEPLKYHRTNDGKFVLYSIGWNEKDDRAVAAKSPEEGDWVWSGSAL